MTEKIIPQDAFKSKKNFEEFMANHNAPEIISVLADYPKANGKAIVTIADLAQNSETIINALSEIKNLPQSPFIVWIVANERENLITAAETLNKFSNKDFGIFIFKASLNNDKIGFKCLLKPEIKTQSYGKAKQIQLKYWERYFEICDEIGSDMQVNPKPQHWQYIPMGKAGVCLQISVGTDVPYICVDLLINKDKSIFENLEKQQQKIEKELGTLDWINEENKKSSKIRKTIGFDVTDESKIEQAIKAHIDLAQNFHVTFSKYL